MDGKTLERRPPSFSPPPHPKSSAAEIGIADLKKIQEDAVTAAEEKFSAQANAIWRAAEAQLLAMDKKHAEAASKMELEVKRCHEKQQQMEDEKHQLMKALKMLEERMLSMETAAKCANDARASADAARRMSAGMPWSASASTSYSPMSNEAGTSAFSTPSVAPPYCATQRFDMLPILPDFPVPQSSWTSTLPPRSLQAPSFGGSSAFMRDLVPPPPGLEPISKEETRSPAFSPARPRASSTNLSIPELSELKLPPASDTWLDSPKSSAPVDPYDPGKLAYLLASPKVVSCPSSPAHQPLPHVCQTPTPHRSSTPARTPPCSPLTQTPKRPSRPMMGSLTPMKSPMRSPMVQQSPFIFCEGGGCVFGFTLRRADGVELGLDFELQDSGDALVITGIKPAGAIEAWNRQCAGGPAAGKAVMVGDKIVDVNSKTDQFSMALECQNSQMLRITILRGDSAVDNISGMWQDTSCGVSSALARRQSYEKLMMKAMATPPRPMMSSSAAPFLPSS